MRDLLQKRKSSGFTIVEVMLVLAIGGLIILIVFLAVPALQRNSRNTQRSNDVSALLGAIGEYQAAQNGALPTTPAQLVSIAKTGYFQGEGTGPSQIALTPVGIGVTLTTGADDDRVVIVTGAKCGGTGGNGAIAGPSRGAVALYQMETSGDPIVKCQAS